MLYFYLFILSSLTSRSKDLYSDTKRSPGARGPVGLQGVLLLGEAQLHHRVEEEQLDEPRAEQPGETLPFSGTSSPYHPHRVRLNMQFVTLAVFKLRVIISLRRVFAVAMTPLR